MSSPRLLLRHAGMVAPSLAIIALASGQTIVPPATSEGSKTETEATSPAASVGSEVPLWSAGGIALHPHISYALVRQTGLRVAPGQSADTTEQSLAPGLGATVGEHWTGDYTATWRRSSNSAYYGGTDHAASVAGNYDFAVWTLGLSGAYTYTHPILTETAAQSRQTTYSAGVASRVRLTTWSWLDLSVNQSYRNAAYIRTAQTPPLTSSRDWSSDDRLSFAVTPKLQASAGAVFGHTSMGRGLDMSYVTPGVGVTWSPINKLSFNANVGREERRFENHLGTLTSTVYSVAAEYAPLPATAVSLSAAQSTSAPYVTDAVVRSRTYQIDLRQRVLERITVSAGVAWQRSNFIGEQTGLPTFRDDRYRTYYGQIATPVLKYGSVGVFYRETKNTSSASGYGFTYRQIGAQISFRF